MKVLLLFMLIILVPIISCKKPEGKDKPSWAKKDIRDYNDADLERLYDQWEEDDEPLENDELPEHLRKGPNVDLSKMDMSNPENLLKMSKKGKTLMTFLTVSDNPTRDETEKITSIWQSSLMNNHINVERYVIADNRVIFMFKDGSLAWDAKDFLVDQERLEEMTIENKPYYGKFINQNQKDEL